MRILGYLQGERATDVSGQAGVVARSLEDVIDERCRRSLTVGARDANHLGIGIAAGKLYLADDVNAFLQDFLNHRSLVGDARALDDLIGIEDALLGVMAFLPRNLVVVEQLLVTVLDGAHVRDEHLEAFLLGQNGSSRPALCGS